MLTILLGVGLIATTIFNVNRTRASGALHDPAHPLLVAEIGQYVWMLMGLAYSAKRRRWSPVIGIMIGFGVELIAALAFVLSRSMT